MKILNCALSLLFFTLLCSPAFAVLGVDKLDPPGPVFDVLSDDLPPTTKAYRKTGRDYERGHPDIREIRKVYDQWLEQAWAGDIHSFLRLGPLMQAYPDADWPVSPTFWEKWVITLLGEGEGYYLLGLDHTWLRTNPYSKVFAEQYFLKSATAGYLDGMYAAFFTGEDRTGPFSVPDDTDISVSRECLSKDTYTDEQVYWITKAANLGHMKSAAFIAVGCWHDATSQKAYVLGEQYFHEASESGASGATNFLLDEHADPHHNIKSDIKKYLYYCFLNLRYHQKGNLEEMESQDQLDNAGQSNGLKKQISSLSAEGIQAIIEQSRITYTTWQKNYEAAKAAKYKLYADAMARMPEVKKAYEAAKRK